MNADALLGLLKAVRHNGHDRYLACCPAHEDRSPSLSIRINSDGRILLHCFSGCHVDDVVSAIGLAMSDLFPDRPLTATAIPGSSMRLKPAEALILLGHESFVIAMLVEELVTIMRAGDAPSDLGINRLMTAVGRIQTVRSLTEEVTPPEIRAIRCGLAA